MRRDARAVEGARLEIVCSDKIGTEGSNPSLSAMHHVRCMARHAFYMVHGGPCEAGLELGDRGKQQTKILPNSEPRTLNLDSTERYRSGHNGADSKSAVRFTADRGFGDPA